MDLTLLRQTNSEFFQLVLKEFNLFDKLFRCLAPRRCFEKNFLNDRGQVVDFNAGLHISHVNRAIRSIGRWKLAVDFFVVNDLSK